MNVKKRQEIRTKTCTDTDKANILWSLHGIECAVISLFFFWCFIFFLFFFVCPPWVLRNMWMWRRWQAFSLLIFWATCALTKRKRKHQQHISFKKNVPNECYSIRDSTAFSNWQQIPNHVSHFMTKLDNLLLDMFLLCFFFSLDFRIKWWTIGWIPVYICRWSNVMPD